MAGQSGIARTESSAQELGRPARVYIGAGVGWGRSSVEASNDRGAKGPYIERANQTTRKAD